MNLIANITKILEGASGESKNGKWSKQDVIVETISSFPKFICLTIWGEKLDKKLIREGAVLNFYFDIESKENNGRWFTNLKVWKIEVPGSELINTVTITQTSTKPPINLAQPGNSQEEEEILPF